MLHTLEIICKGPVKLIKVRFRLDEDHPAQVIEIQKAVMVQPLLQGLHQRQPFIQGYFQAVGPQQVKEL